MAVYCLVALLLMCVAGGRSGVADTKRRMEGQQKRNSGRDENMKKAWKKIKVKRDT